MINVVDILDSLPPFQNNYETIEEKQEVNDIIREVLDSHKIFEKDYDFIEKYFSDNPEKLAKELFTFLKKNVNYKEESEKLQTTKSPKALLINGAGDCKHYANFIAGILSAKQRKGVKLNYVYRFAGYNYFDDKIQHVFIVLNPGKNEVWIDPVLESLNQRRPYPKHYIDYKILNNMLQRVSGITEGKKYGSIEFDSPGLNENSFYNYATIPEPDEIEGIIQEPEEIDLPSDLQEAIKILVYYGVINPIDQKVDNDRYSFLIEDLDSVSANELSGAYGLFLQYLENEKSIGNIFGSIWSGVKTVALAPMRGAYLAMVSLNVFNLAGRLHKALYNPGGQIDQDSLQRIRNIWVKKFEGHTDNLLKAVQNGYKKNAFLGGLNSIGDPTAPAWALAAAAIIAAMAPVISGILKGKQMRDSEITAADISGNYGNGSLENYTQSGFDFKKWLPFIAIGGVGIYLLTQKKRK